MVITNDCSIFCSNTKPAIISLDNTVGIKLLFENTGCFSLTELGLPLILLRNCRYCKKKKLKGRLCFVKKMITLKELPEMPTLCFQTTGKTLFTIWHVFISL